MARNLKKTSPSFGPYSKSVLVYSWTQRHFAVSVCHLNFRHTPKRDIKKKKKRGVGTEKAYALRRAMLRLSQAWIGPTAAWLEIVIQELQDSHVKAEWGRLKKRGDNEMKGSPERWRQERHIKDAVMMVKWQKQCDGERGGIIKKMAQVAVGDKWKGAGEGWGLSFGWWSISVWESVRPRWSVSVDAESTQPVYYRGGGAEAPQSLSREF